MPAWLPVAQRPNGALLLHHLAQQHPDQLRPYLERMRTEEISTVAAEAYDVVEEPKHGQDLLYLFGELSRLA